MAEIEASLIELLLADAAGILVISKPSMPDTVVRFWARVEVEDGSKVEPIEVVTEDEGVMIESTDEDVDADGRGGGDIAVCLIDALVGLGLTTWSFALVIFASHPRTRSTDLPLGPCVGPLALMPSPNPTSIPVGLLDPLLA